MRARIPGFILLIFLETLVLGQETAQPPVPSVTFSAQAPIVLYHLVRAAVLLDREATKRDQKDGTGGELRDALANTVGLSDTDAKVFFAFARVSDGRFAALDQQAARIVEQARAQRTSEGVIPPPPPDLNLLQNQKSALMRALSTNLDGAGMSEAGKAAMQQYLSRAAAKTTSIASNAQ